MQHFIYAKKTIAASFYLCKNNNQIQNKNEENGKLG